MNDNALTTTNDLALPPTQEEGTAPTIIPYNTINSMVEDWLAACASNSPRTLKAYRDMMADFRDTLRDKSIDLLSSPADVSAQAGKWAARVNSKDGKPVSASTFNLRLNCISSFFKYVGKLSALAERPIPNPISIIDRKPVQPYAKAQAIASKDIKRMLKAIPRDDLQGRRDYALLNVLLSTGRRLSEVVGMQRADLVIGTNILITFRCKGKQIMHDRLSEKQSTALLDWLNAYYGPTLANLPPDAPIWVSLSHANYGKPLGPQSVADICKRILGTSKVHTTRHTLAHMMDERKATNSQIQRQLGHKHSSTTEIYIDRVRDADNPLAADIDELLGTGD